MGAGRYGQFSGMSPTEAGQLFNHYAEVAAGGTDSLPGLRQEQTGAIRAAAARDAATLAVQLRVEHGFHDLTYPGMTEAAESLGIELDLSQDPTQTQPLRVGVEG